MSGEKIIDGLTGKNQVLKGLEDTKFMLMVISGIVLAGVIATAYSSYWQGKYARLMYKKEMEKYNGNG